MLVRGPNAGNVVLVQCKLENGNLLNEGTREERCVAIQYGTCEHSQTEMVAVCGTDVMSLQTEMVAECGSDVMSLQRDGGCVWCRCDVFTARDGGCVAQM
jgi:hypothetical protein